MSDDENADQKWAEWEWGTNCRCWRRRNAKDYWEGCLFSFQLSGSSEFQDPFHHSLPSSAFSLSLSLSRSLALPFSGMENDASSMKSLHHAFNKISAVSESSTKGVCIVYPTMRLPIIQSVDKEGWVHSLTPLHSSPFHFLRTGDREETSRCAIPTWIYIDVKMSSKTGGVQRGVTSSEKECLSSEKGTRDWKHRSIRFKECFVVGTKFTRTLVPSDIGLNDRQTSLLSFLSLSLSSYLEQKERSLWRRWLDYLLLKSYGYYFTCLPPSFLSSLFSVCLCHQKDKNRHSDGESKRGRKKSRLKWMDGNIINFDQNRLLVCPNIQWKVVIYYPIRKRGRERQNGGRKVLSERNHCSIHDIHYLILLSGLFPSLLPASLLFLLHPLPLFTNSLIHFFIRGVNS